ncbi:MAG: hypothetical protein K2H40_09345 [Lachnospiraceae bacterium]|nr:hypothetical protein [Lachnospiraceae bacterium]
MDRKKKIMWAVLLITECLIVLSCFLFYRKEGKNITLYPADFISEEGIFLENFLDTGMDGYYIDSSFEKNEDFARTEGIDLSGGCYLIRMYYAAEGGPQSYTLDKKDADFRFWIGNWHENLPSENSCYTASMWSIRGLENFQIAYHYSGDGYLLVGKVEIIEQKTWAIALMGFLIVFFIILNLLLLYKERVWAYFSDAEHRIQWLGCFMIIVFASIPLLAPAMFRGHDLEFHLLRIEGVKEGLQSGQFPVKIQPNWMNGYGYGASFFYGDILLYFPAALRLCGLGVQSAYKAFVLLMNVLTCLFSYYAFKRFFNNSRVGLAGSFLYTCAVYRLTCVYIRAAVGEYSAMTFLPLFFVGISEILFGGNIAAAFTGNEVNDIKERKIKGWMLAALSYTGILYSHVITSEMAALFTIFAGLIFWRHTFRKDRLLQILKCGLAILGCSAGFLVPFLDMSRDSYWFNMEPIDSGMQTSGASLNQVFSIFPNGAGEALASTTMERTMPNAGEMPYAIGAGYLAAVVIFLMYCIYYDKAKDAIMKIGRRLLLFSALAVWMTTSFFPWNDLQMLMGPLKFMVKNIQFPWRVLGISTLALTFFSCTAISIFRRWNRWGTTAIAVILSFAVISSGYLLSDRMSDNFVWCVQNVDGLDDFHIMGGEYIPEGGDYADKSITVPEYSPGIEIRHQERDYHCFRISCRNGENVEGYIDMPLLYYRGYAAEDTATGSSLRVEKSELCKVRVIVPAGYEGEISLLYREYWYWRVAEMIELISVVAIAYVCFARKIIREKVRLNFFRNFVR